ncbi:MAG: hypothetical protein ABWK53_00150, partial [Anaerolineales bacterium]
LEAAPAPVAEVEAASEAPGEEEFEKMFSLENIAIQPAVVETSAEEKKGKKKAKKDRALEFDEERGEVVARKKHKRGEDGWDEDW